MTSYRHPGSGAHVSGPGWSGFGPDHESAEPRVVIRDRRRIDPNTYTVRDQTNVDDQTGDAVGTDPTEPMNEGEVLDPQSSDAVGSVNPQSSDAVGSVDGSEAAAAADQADAATEAIPENHEADAGIDPEIAAAKAEAAERTEDLKRLQAEYVNYKRRVDRDRELQKQAGIEKVLHDLMGVLDDLRAAKQHEELSGGFKLVAEEIEKVAHKHGLEAYGEKDDPFDPQIHEALMQVPTPGVTEPTCLDVMQVGYRRGERVLRAARVAVAMPSEEQAEG